MCIGIILRFASCAGKGICLFGNHSSRLMRKDIKIGYGLLTLIFSVFIFALIFFLNGWIDFAGSYFGCPSGDGLAACLGLGAAFR